MALVKTSAGAYLNADAAASYEALNKAFTARFKKRLPITSGARTYDQQAAIFKSNYNPYYTVAEAGRVEVRIWNGVKWYRKAWHPTTAVPGTSNHEYPPGKAADFGGGVQTRNSAEHNWMLQNAPKFGWAWTGKNFSTVEPWHWEKLYVWSGGGATPLPPKPVPPVDPDEDEDDDMAKMKGAVYSPTAGKYVYILFNEVSGWYLEHSGTPSSYNNPLAQNWETNSWPTITLAHAKGLKASLDKVRLGV